MLALCCLRSLAVLVASTSYAATLITHCPIRPHSQLDRLESISGTLFQSNHNHVASVSLFTVPRLRRVALYCDFAHPPPPPLGYRPAFERLPVFHNSSWAAYQQIEELAIFNFNFRMPLANLRVLHLSSREPFPDDFAAAFPHLERAIFGDLCEFLAPTYPPLAALAGCKHLTSLTLATNTYYPATELSLAPISRLAALRELTLSGFTNVERRRGDGLGDNDFAPDEDTEIVPTHWGEFEAAVRAPQLTRLVLHFWPKWWCSKGPSWPSDGPLRKVSAAALQAVAPAGAALQVVFDDNTLWQPTLLPPASTGFFD